MKKILDIYVPYMYWVTQTSKVLFIEAVPKLCKYCRGARSTCTWEKMTAPLMSPFLLSYIPECS